MLNRDSSAKNNKEFKEIFQDTPNHWLVKRRLEEARFLMEKKSKRPSDVYLNLGFEDISHFSFAFKKQFGFSPTEHKAKTEEYGRHFEHN